MGLKNRKKSNTAFTQKNNPVCGDMLVQIAWRVETQL